MFMALLFNSIPEAFANGHRYDYLAGLPGTPIPASHPMALLAVDRVAREGVISFVDN